jgi:hypothetical protein
MSQSSERKVHVAPPLIQLQGLMIASGQFCRQ